MDEMFNAMHVLTKTTTCTILVELEVWKWHFGSYMRTGVMDDSQWYYNHDEDIKVLHVGMGNVDT